jgi:hypothetical protein
MKAIPLTQNKFALVDDEDFERLNKIKWCAHNLGNTTYAAHSDYAKGECLHMHRLVLPCEKPFMVDHLDGNGLNNQKYNLRIVTQRQNLQNLHIKKSSIYPGVCWDKQTNKWRALITIDNKRHCLGRYAKEGDAFDAYCRKLKEIGEVLNG